MKAIFFILLVISNSLFSQEMKGVILDSSSDEPIQFANILNLSGKGVYSDELGNFQIQIKQTDTLKISAYGYEPQYYLANTKNNIPVTFKLSPKITDIDEVVLSANKVNYKRRVSIGEDRVGNISVTSLIGYETCVYIENEEKTKGKIQSVFIDLKKRSNADLVAILNLKFYEYDSINDKPGKEISKESIKVTPRNGKYRLKISTIENKIMFPKNGICVGVEMMYEQKEVDKYKKFGPAFRYTLSESRKSITWSNYHNRGWKKSDFKVPNLKTKNLEYSNPMIGIEVLYP